MNLPCLRAAALCALFLGIGDGRAAILCATTSGELAAALEAAAINGQHDEIRIAVGTYLTPGAPFEYDSTVLDADGMDVSISGGWTEFSGNACGRRLAANQQQTILDGQGVNRVFQAILTEHGGSLSLRYLRIQNGYVTSAFKGGGAHVVMSPEFLGRLFIEGVYFAFNHAEQYGGALHLSAPANHSGVSILNNVFMFNAAECRFGAVMLGQESGASMYFVNNTVAYNSHGDTCTHGEPGAGGADFIIVGADANVAIVNNLFWANESQDVAVRGSFDATATYRHNNHGIANLERVGDTGGNLSVDPRLKSSGFGSLQFPTHQLEEDSPMVDAGAPPPGYWYLLQGDFDVDGQPRVKGRGHDIGAFEEQTPLFGSGFEGLTPLF